MAFGAWRDDFLLIARAGTPPNSPSILTDSSTTLTPAAAPAALSTSALRHRVARDLQASFGSYMPSSSSSNSSVSDWDSAEESALVIGKDDPKEWAISVLFYLKAKYPGGGSGALANKKAQVPLRLKGRRKRIH